MVVVKWSACSPYSPMIRVRIPLTPTVFPYNLCLKRTKIKKEAGVGPFFKKVKIYFLNILLTQIINSRRKFQYCFYFDKRLSFRPLPSKVIESKKLCLCVISRSRGLLLVSVTRWLHYFSKFSIYNKKISPLLLF